MPVPIYAYSKHCCYTVDRCCTVVHVALFVHYTARPPSLLQSCGHWKVGFCYSDRDGKCSRDQSKLAALNNDWERIQSNDAASKCKCMVELNEWTKRDTCGGVCDTCGETCNYQKCQKDITTERKCFTVNDIIQGINGIT